MARRNEEKWFYVFIFPWLLGFLIFTLGPILASIYFSLTDWDLFSLPKFIGFANYIKLVTEDKIFWKTVYNTFYYAIIAIPMNIAISLALAYLLYHNMRGMRFYRTIFYLPAIVPTVASSMLFIWLLAPNTGLINRFLALFGIKGPAWLLDPQWVKMSFVFMEIWAVGFSMVLILSAMKGVPLEIYEAASLDGANRARQFFNITIPMITPVIFFNLVMGIIRCLQVFSQVYIMTKGGPNNASNMIVPYLFDNAFKFYRMGYASSIAWILFVIIILITLLILRSSSVWVFYESEVKR
ncbi:MAG: sugar ABC transporter permease [Actinobacteria bacterium]|nr:sugar ABC transporter permease [Actinomycetota bacterium]